MCVLRAMSKKTNRNLRNHEKSRNSLTLKNKLHNNISIVLYLLKNWSYDILSMRKRISLIFYICPLFFNLFGWKIWNFWKIKNMKISKFWKNLTFSKQIWNLKISKFFWKIWKSETILKLKKNENLKNMEDFEKKSQNLKIWRNLENVEKISKSKFQLFFSSRKLFFQDFEEKLFWTLLHVHFADLCCSLDLLLGFWDFI